MCRHTLLAYLLVTAASLALALFQPPEASQPAQTDVVHQWLSLAGGWTR